MHASVYVCVYSFMQRLTHLRQPDSQESGEEIQRTRHAEGIAESLRVFFNAEKHTNFTIVKHAICWR